VGTIGAVWTRWNLLGRRFMERYCLGGEYLGLWRLAVGQPLVQYQPIGFAQPEQFDQSIGQPVGLDFCQRLLVAESERWQQCERQPIDQPIALAECVDQCVAERLSLALAQSVAEPERQSIGLGLGVAQPLAVFLAKPEPCADWASRAPIYACPRGAQMKWA